MSQRALGLTLRSLFSSFPDLRLDLRLGLAQRLLMRQALLLLGPGLLLGWMLLWERLKSLRLPRLPLKLGLPRLLSLSLLESLWRLGIRLLGIMRVR